MARETVEIIRSSLSGATLTDDEAWIVELTEPNGSRPDWRLDASEAELADIRSKAEPITYRGREPKPKKKLAKK